MNQKSKLVETCIQLAGLAYSKPEQIQPSLKMMKFNEFEFIENKETDTQVFCCRKGNKVYVVFRGTEFTNIQDWITNLDCEITYVSPNARGHKGFNDDVESVLDEIRAYIKSQGIYARVNVTGHSQGAGDATLAGIKLIDQKEFAINSVIPVASPRCVDRVTADYYKNSYGYLFTRVVNNNDVVTRVPTRSMGYWHIDGTDFIYIKETGEIVSEISNWNRFLDRIHGRIADFGKLGTDGLKDHYWEIYLSQVKAFNKL